VTVGGAAKRAVSSVLGARGYEVRRISAPPPERQPAPPTEPTPDPGAATDPRTVDYFVRAREIDERHAAQTLADVDALRRRYTDPVFGEVRVWDLVEQLARCVDPSDCALFCTSQQTHVLQMLEGMANDGIDDPELLLAVLIHDLGKLLLVVGEDPANVVCMNTPIGNHEPGIGLDQCTFQWNHDEFGYSRFRDHVSDGVAWLVRYHSMDVATFAPLMNEQDREYVARYFEVFTRYDHGTKTPFHLPALRIDTYRDLVEDAFPDPIAF
jgi:hypothetical protein